MTTPDEPTAAVAPMRRVIATYAVKPDEAATVAPGTAHWLLQKNVLECGHERVDASGAIPIQITMSAPCNECPPAAVAQSEPDAAPLSDAEFERIRRACQDGQLMASDTTMLLWDDRYHRREVARLTVAAGEDAAAFAAVAEEVEALRTANGRLTAQVAALTTGDAVMREALAHIEGGRRDCPDCTGGFAPETVLDHMGDVAHRALRDTGTTEPGG